MSRTLRTEQAPRVQLFVATWFAYATYYLGRKGFGVAKAAIDRELGLGTGALALIDTAFLAAYAVGQLPSGLAADRIGPRRVVGAGLLLSAAACLAFGMAGGVAAFAVCFALNGLAQATGWPGTTKAVAALTTPADRGRVMGLWSTCYQVGGVVATLAASYLLGHFGWRAVFVGPALVLSLAGVLVWRLLRVPVTGAAPNEPSPRHLGDASLGGALGLRAAASRALRAVAEPLALGRLASYGACYFCLKLIRYSVLFWLPYYLHREGGFEPVQSGYMSTAFEIGGVFGSVALGWVSDRVAAGRAQVAALSIVGLSCALWGYGQVGHASAAWHMAWLALIGLLLFGPDALLSGAAAQEAGGRTSAATAVAIVNGLGSLGALLQGALTLGVQRAFGWHALFGAFCALSLLACACLLPSLRRRPRGS